MGRPLKLEHQRYTEAGSVPAVYLAEVGGMVKVGQSDKPTHRLIQLHQKHARKGERLGRFQAFPVRGSAYDAERECIAALSLVSVNAPGCSEYFTGISFDAALEVVRGAMPIAGGSLSVGTAHRPITPYGVARRTCLSA